MCSNCGRLLTCIAILVDGLDVRIGMNKTVFTRRCLSIGITFRNCVQFYAKPSLFTPITRRPKRLIIIRTQLWLNLLAFGITLIRISDSTMPSITGPDWGHRSRAVTTTGSQWRTVDAIVGSLDSFGLICERNSFYEKISFYAKFWQHFW